MLVQRRRAPGQERRFRTPLAWLVGPCAILGCLYLFGNLPERTRLFFFAWNGVGLIYYVVWKKRRAA